MGETYINLADFGDGEEHDKWYSLQSEPTKKKQDPNQKGEIRVKCHFSGPPGSKPSKSGTTSSASSSTPATSPTKDAPKEKPKEKAAEDKSKSSKDGPVKIEDKYNMGDVIGRFFSNSLFKNL